jgi:hypothetical protein
MRLLVRRYSPCKSVLDIRVPHQIHRTPTETLGFPGTESATRPKGYWAMSTTLGTDSMTNT